MRYLVKINGKQYDVEIEKMGAQQGMQVQQAPPMQQAAPMQQPSGGKDTEVVSPMPGSVFDIQVAVGQTVSAGQNLIILEAMKMENEIVAPCNGTVKQILVSKGAMVDTNDVLVVLN